MALQEDATCRGEAMAKLPSSAGPVQRANATCDDVDARRKIYGPRTSSNDIHAHCTTGSWTACLCLRPSLLCRCSKTHDQSKPKFTATALSLQPGQGSRTAATALVSHAIPPRRVPMAVHVCLHRSSSRQARTEGHQPCWRGHRRRCDHVIRFRSSTCQSTDAGRVSSPCRESGCQPGANCTPAIRASAVIQVCLRATEWH